MDTGLVRMPTTQFFAHALLCSFWIYTEKFTHQERQCWISYFQSFQNERHGYFEPDAYYHQDKERNCSQLTCFCLSALRILGAEENFGKLYTMIEQIIAK